MPRKKLAVTINDVAYAAGVSDSTVSQVLNGNDDASQETHDKVLRVIDGRGYASSLAARSMRSHSHNVIGVLMVAVNDPFSIEVVRGIGEAIRQYRYDLLIYSSGRPHSRSEADWKQYQVRTLNGVLEAIQTAGLSVPHDITANGFDNNPESAYTVPPLTTIEQSLRCMGATAESRC